MPRISCIAPFALQLGLLVSTTLGCERVEKLEKTLTEVKKQDAAALCAAKPTSTPADAQLTKHQLLLVSAPQAAASWTQVGRDFVRIARVQTEPSYYRNADACAQEALSRDPRDADALRLRGLALMNDHRFDEARTLARSIIARDADDPVAWSLLSDAQLEIGDMTEAISAAQRMVDLKPNLPAYGRAAYLRWLQGDSQGAKLLYQQAIQAGSEHKDREPMAWMLVQAAWVFWHEGDYAGADAGFEVALQRVPEYAPALEGKGRAALARGDYAAAERYLKRAYDKHPLMETAWLLGDALELAGRTRDANVWYERVVAQGEKLDPRTLSLFLATKDRDAESALRLARKEYETRKDLYTKDALAWASYRSHQLPEAKRLALEAIAFGTPDARLLYHAGKILEATGDAADAKRGAALITRALQLNPHFDRLLTGASDATVVTTR